MGGFALVVWREIKMWNWFFKLGSPPHFYRTATLFEPWLMTLAVVLLLIGSWGGLVLAPPDYLQGEGFRIIYVHVPAAFLSMFAYAVMAVASAIGLIWRMELAYCVAVAAAPPGAAFTLLALATGAIWGQPMWGTWWEWDPRLTSELVLLFLFLGVTTCMRLMLALSDSFEQQLAPFLGFMLGGGIALFGVLAWRNPSKAMFSACFAAPLAVFFAITNFLLGQYGMVFLFTIGTCGFAVLAMLIPALSEFNVATSTGETREG